MNEPFRSCRQPATPGSCRKGSPSAYHCEVFFVNNLVIHLTYFFLRRCDRRYYVSSGPQHRWRKGWRRPDVCREEGRGRGRGEEELPADCFHVPFPSPEAWIPYDPIPIQEARIHYESPKLLQISSGATFQRFLGFMEMM